MKDWQAILKACAGRENFRAALATVVEVVGSAYRRPGARMIVFEDGQSAGSVSGGCLENDVRRRAQWVIHSQSAQLVTYDAEEDEESFGRALGCGGSVRILIEPLLDSSDSILNFVSIFLQKRCPIAFATLLLSESMVCHELQASNGSRFGHIQDENLQREIDEKLTQLLSGEVVAGLQRLNNVQVFYELIQPPLVLLLCGKGPESVSLIRFAQELGWQATLIDLSAPFPVERIDAQTAVLVMTHNFQRDKELLCQLLPHAPKYLGVLGPKHRTQRLLDELQYAPLPNFYGPIGLDIGAETPEQIALAIVAEIQAVFSGYSGGSLRDRPGSIHPQFS